MTAESVKVITTEAEAQSWLLPNPASVVNYWGIYGVSQSKNLIIGFVYKSLGILLPDTISYIYQDEGTFSWVIADCAKDYEKQWWNKIVRISKLVTRGGKRIGAFSHSDFQTLKWGMYKKWLKEKKTKRTEASDLLKDFVEEDKEITGKQILNQEEMPGDKVDFKGEHNITQFSGIDEEVEKFEEKGIIGLSSVIDKDLESRSPELGSEQQDSSTYSHLHEEHSTITQHSSEWSMQQFLQRDLKIPKNEKNNFLIPEENIESSNVGLLENPMVKQITQINSEIRTMEAFRFDSLLSLHLKESKTCLVLQNSFEQEQENNKKAIADRNTLALEVWERNTFIMQLEERERQLTKKMEDLEREDIEIKEISDGLEKELKEATQYEKSLAEQIVKANALAHQAASMK
ncbi:hypothetical protein L873DRAFT_1796573 [Choiromyces venosus 120613-1]|uniref:Uncharacterized protein n=1 Tax=Choiromyces venosus 120613-1 TaxID=1336337 RepID=A0A3N4J3Y2_9PEZI|nr:hypothetical protein L873DRAFT_1796573 [Choiromyces venosus 120613-1]